MRQAGLILLWLAVLFGLVAWYVDAQQSFSVPEAMGKFLIAKGNVQFQTEKIPVWTKVQKGQDVFDGNTISTGEGAMVEIQLASGKRFELGPDSQVKLSAALSLLKPDYMVSVLVGSLKVKEEASSLAGNRLVQDFTRIGLKALGQKETTRIRVGDKVIEVSDSKTGQSQSQDNSRFSDGSILDLSRSRNGMVSITSHSENQLILRDDTTGQEEILQGSLETSAMGALGKPVEGAEDLASGLEVMPLSTTWADERLVETTLELAELAPSFQNRVLWHSASFRNSRVEAFPVPVVVSKVDAEGLERLAKRQLVVRIDVGESPKIQDEKAPQTTFVIEMQSDKNAWNFVLRPELLAKISAVSPGLLNMNVTFGIRSEQPDSDDVVWAKRTWRLALASVEDLAPSSVRFSLDEWTWRKVRAYFEGRMAPNISPHWFWQGRDTSAVVRTQRRSLQRKSVPLHATIDFFDGRLASKFASLFPPDAEFLIESLPAVRDARQGAQSALRFASGGISRLVLFAAEDALLEVVQKDVARGLFDWVSARVAWLGAEGQALEPAAFFARLEQARADTGSFDWLRAGPTFHVVVGNRVVPVEWQVALGHPLFARSMFAKAEVFFPAATPRVWLTPSSEGTP